MTTPTINVESIPPGERRELRSVVRAQFRVLRAEVTQREATLMAEGEERLRQRYLASDKAVADVNKKIEAIVAAAQKKVDAAIVASGIATDAGQFRSRLGQVKADHVYTSTNDTRRRLRDSFTSAIRAQGRTAMLALDRQEADLLRALAIEGLKTEQGQAFLGQIPAITALMPSERLREVEAAFDRGATT